MPRCELVGFARDRPRHRDGDQITVLQRWAFAVQRVHELCARLALNDKRGAPLYKRDPGSARIKVLGDVVTAVASADHHGRLALPVLAVDVLARVDDFSGETS